MIRKRKVQKRNWSVFLFENCPYLRTPPANYPLGLLIGIPDVMERNLALQDVFRLLPQATVHILTILTMCNASGPYILVPTYHPHRQLLIGYCIVFFELHH